MHATASSGERFAVAAGCVEAVDAALSCHRAGGNVVDAAIAGSAAMCVTMPQATGIGGDLFALVKFGDDITAINASGGAPRRATIEAMRKRGHAMIPYSGPVSIETPGLVAGWGALHERFASRPLLALLGSAIALARDGFRLSPRLADCLAAEFSRCAVEPGFRDVFAPNGRLLGPGDRLTQPTLAATLESITRDGVRGFYAGRVARDIARTVADAGGLLDEHDLSMVRAERVAPIACRFRGVEILTQPPVSQGAILLRALSLLDGHELRDDRHRWSVAVRALARAFEERLGRLGDGPDSAERARAMIEGRAGRGIARPALAQAGDETTSLCVMDREGNAVSLIQSVFADFGSGVIARESGVLLNNRLSGFFLDPAHPNALSPGRRTMHTLHSWFVRDADGLLLAGGTPGGDNQPQVNLQVLMRLIELGETPIRAIDAPRWAIAPGTEPKDLGDTKRVRVEPGLDVEALADLATVGLPLDRLAGRSLGSVKMVGRDPGTGGISAWADGRREAAARAA
ncbi:MAG: hypothetical protein FJX57_11005 [Alphaproteobacteria bacterium]|nr:hypothetical protein [Alphaproteobacteria bacterium]